MINENIINISIVYMLYSAYIEWPFSNLRLFDDNSNVGLLAVGLTVWLVQQFRKAYVQLFLRNKII